MHGPGDILGRPVVLTREEKRFLSWAYEVDGDGRRVVRRALVGLPKGSRKTEFAAWVALAEMAGPVRFAGWREDGLPEGRAVVDPYVVASASSYEQADLLFTAARACITEGPLKDFFVTFDNEIQIKEQPGVLKRVPAVAGTNDGLPPTFVVADEVHEWTGSKQRVHLVIENGLAKREGAWSCSITTTSGRSRNRTSAINRNPGTSSLSFPVSPAIGPVVTSKMRYCGAFRPVAAGASPRQCRKSSILHFTRNGLRPSIGA